MRVSWRSSNCLDAVQSCLRLHQSCLRLHLQARPFCLLRGVRLVQELLSFFQLAAEGVLFLPMLRVDPQHLSLLPPF